MSKVKILLLVGCLLSYVSWPFVSRAETSDLAIYPGSVKFSSSQLIAGQTVRVYATIVNVGDIDVSAQVLFYQSDSLIGKTQIVSVLANGGQDDVYVDYALPSGSFNIRAVIQGADPIDTNPSNDEVITPLYQTLPDADGDKIVDSEDNCPERGNVDQADLDNDQQGDVCDDDIDGDGVKNLKDPYPRDATKWEITSPKPPVVPVPKPTVNESAKPEAAASVSPKNAELSSAVPEPEVLGEEISAAKFLSPDIGSGQVSFKATSLNWRTYRFAVTEQPGADKYTYSWDFGDGTTSAQTNIDHRFSKPGIYTVKLGQVSDTGEISTASQMVTVSFFHLENPIVIATLVVLSTILLGLIWLMIRLRQGREV
jgi:hypothetical protein